MLDERGKEEKRGSKHAMCPEAGSRVQCSQAEKTKARLNFPRASGSIESIRPSLCSEEASLKQKG